MKDTSSDDGLVDLPQRRKGPRRREETEEDRRRLEQETAGEIDQLAAQFHAQLPRDRARAVGAIYARYSSRFQHSIVDQVRTLFEAAVRQEIYVPSEHVCFDQAVRGYKDRRPGLQRLRTLLPTGAVQVLLVFTTNRLYRKTYKALQFVEEEVVERGIRCLFVKSGIDSGDEKRWRMLLQINAMTDEFVAGMYADNIRAAQEGLFQRKQVCGTVTFGYRPREVVGPPTRRKRPRCEYEIDPEESHWVRRIFSWFVEEGLDVIAIVRKLNTDPTAPLPPKASSGRWTRLAVRILLANARYRGWWEYGRTKNVWQSKKDYSRQVNRERPLQEGQFEELRIVPDALWYQAQKRLAEESGPRGRKPKDGDHASRPKLLNGFFVCQAHGRALHVGGSHGHVMVCPVCQGLPADQRPVFSQLNRVLALRLTCQKLADLIRADTGLVEEVIKACEQEVLRRQQPDRRREAELRARHEKLTQQIQFILFNAGDSVADRQEAEATLRRLRGERAQTAADLALLEEARQRPVAVPSREEIQRLLVGMGEILSTAGQSRTVDEIARVRQVVKLLTGGRIELTQQGERQAQRGWLQGRFRLRCLASVVAPALGLPASEADEGVEVTIDFREPAEAEQWADRVKQLYDEGLLIRSIATRLSINRNLARKALACWYDRRGERPPDGRRRRSTLPKKHAHPPLYQQIADRVKELYDEGRLLEEIAARLGHDRNMITKAIVFWHEARDLVVPDGRSRRKSLNSRSWDEEDDEDEAAEGG